jgi:hypothetical protein
MPFTQPWLEVNFGTAYAGLVGTVGYRLYQADDSDSVARTTASIFEIGTNTGCYGVVPPSIPDNAVGIEWDTGGGSPVSATEDLDLYRRMANAATEIDTTLSATHGAGSWQQSVVTGASLNAVPNSNSLVTVGNVIAGTYASTALLDGSYWQIEDVAGQIDMYFEFLIPADGVPTGITNVGRMAGLGDDLDVFAWNWGGAAWEQIGVLVGKNTPADETNTYVLFPQHVGTGADLGKVRVRYYQAAGLTSADFYSDQVVLSYSVINRSVGYADGAIWVDTLNGTPGATVFINGTADNPVDTLADALTLSAALNINRFRFAPGSSVTLGAAYDNYVLAGTHWTLDLNGQSISDTAVVGADVTGTAIAANSPHFVDCEIGTVTLPACHLHACSITSDITLSSAGAYFFDQCYSGVAGTATPSVDFGAAVGDTQLNMRHYSGGIEVKNMGQSGTDNMSLEGHGQLVINATCTGGTIAVRGSFPHTDNAGGAVTLSDDARFAKTDLADHLETSGANPHGTGAWDATVSPSTVATAVWSELVPAAFGAGSAGLILGTNLDVLVSSRSTPAQITAAQIAILAELTRLMVAVETTAVAGSSPTEIRTGLTEADDFYNNMQVVVINAAGVAARNVDDFANINGAITVTALPFTPAATDPVIILARTGSVPVDVSAIADGVWDENIVAAHGGANSSGLLLRVLGALISTRANNATLAELLGVADAAGVDLPEQIDTELTGTHGAGSWAGSGGRDWTAAEREQFRSALGINGTKTAAVGGQFQQFLIGVSATVAAGSTVTEVRTNLGQADGFWNNLVMIVENTSGSGERVARNIDNYANANGALTTFVGLPWTPQAGDNVFIAARTGSLRDDNGPIGCL